MKITEIYEMFDRIGCLTFATLDHGLPQTRIAHLFAHDDEGLYFRTMITKAFYRQLKNEGTVSICGMYPKTTVSHDGEGMPYFEPGYTIRLTGEVREVSLEDLKQKAQEDRLFELGVKDIERYPAMTTFCISSGWGEVYDFDFEMEHRDHKLLRTAFSYGGSLVPFRGMRIGEDCIACGECMQGCSFKAISMEGDRYVIDSAKCDVCGDCYNVCPADAVEVLIEAP